jgi:hypothetical protein
MEGEERAIIFVLFHFITTITLLSFAYEWLIFISNWQIIHPVIQPIEYFFIYLPLYPVRSILTISVILLRITYVSLSLFFYFSPQEVNLLFFHPERLKSKHEMPSSSTIIQLKMAVCVGVMHNAICFDDDVVR